MTNAAKAQIIAVLNSGLSLLIAFGITLSDAQTAAVTGFANACLLLWVGLTYKDSPKRKSD